MAASTWKKDDDSSLTRDWTFAVNTVLRELDSQLEFKSSYSPSFSGTFARAELREKNYYICNAPFDPVRR